MSHKIAPTRMYTFVFLSLVVLTVVTVGAARQDLGGGGNIALGLLIAVVKASLVVLFFMHLKWDAKEDLSIRYFAIFPILLFLIAVTGNMPDIGLRIGDQKPTPVAKRQYKVNIHAPEHETGHH